MERNLLEQLLGIPHFGFTDPYEQFDDETVNILTSEDIRAVRSNLLMPYIGYIKEVAKTLTPEELQSHNDSGVFAEGFRTAIAFVLAGRTILDGGRIDEELIRFRVCDERDAFRRQNMNTGRRDEGCMATEEEPANGKFESGDDEEAGYEG